MSDSNTPVPRAQRTDISNIDAELSAEARSIKQSISAPGAPKITINRAGSFSGPANEDLGTSIRGVVVDFLSSNKYYDKPYNSAAPEPPACFAFGKVLNEMVPSPNSPVIQAEQCLGCPRNEWGSDIKGGKGKACKNARELAFILEEDLGEEDPPIYQVSVPPTGIRSFDGFAAMVSTMLDGPPIKAVVTIECIQQNGYNTMVFKDPDNNPDYAFHAQFRPQALELISREPDVSGYTPNKLMRK